MDLAQHTKIPVVQDAMARVRFASEQRLYDELLRDPDVQKRAQEVLKEDETEASRRQLLATGLRITDRIIPSLVETVEWAQRVTHLENRSVEVYVCDDPRQNAACLDPGQGSLFLLLSSSLVEKMTHGELIFVIGHELGHAAFGHQALPVRAILSKTHDVPAKLAMRLLSWNRRAEVSCDRVGLLCCQDVNVATTSLIKLSCGLTESLVHFNVDDYVSQMQDIQQLSDSVRNTQDWFSSHPFNPLRVVALHHFWESSLLADLLGHTPGRVPIAEADKKIDTLLEFMEPDMAGSEEQVANESLLWGGFWVAASDGRIDAVESASIREMIDARAVQQAEADIKASPAPLAFIKERFQQAAKKCQAMQPSKRHALVQRLIVVARTDKQLKEQEKAVLRQVCEALGINPLFVEQILMMTG